MRSRGIQALEQLEPTQAVLRGLNISVRIEYCLAGEAIGHEIRKQLCMKAQILYAICLNMSIYRNP